LIMNLAAVVERFTRRSAANSGLLLSNAERNSVGALPAEVRQ